MLLGGALLLALLGCPPDAPTPPSSGAPLLGEGEDGQPAEDLRFTRLTIELEGRTSTLERTARGWWLMTPVRAPADPVAVDELLEVLGRGALREVIAESPDAATLSALGLAPPRLRVVAEAEGGARRVLEGGSERPFDGSIPLRRAQAPSVYAGGGHLRRVLEREAYDLRSKRLFPFAPEAVTQVEIRPAGGQAWSLVRTAEGWQQQLPPTFEAAPSRVQELVRRLLSLRARRFEPDTPQSPAGVGLRTPAFVVRLGDAGAPPVEIEVSDEAPGRSRTVWVRWKVEGADPTLAEVDARLLELIGTDPQTLRSRRLLRFEADRVARLELEYADLGPITLLRGGGGEAADAGASVQWTLTSGELRRPISSLSVSAFLWSASQLRAHAPRDPVREPLVPPPEGLRSVRLLDVQGGLLGHLELGDADPGQPDRTHVLGGAQPAWATSAAVRVLREAGAPAAFGLGQDSAGAPGDTSPKKDP